MRWFFGDRYDWDVAAATSVNSGGTVGEVARLATDLREAARSGDVGPWIEGFGALSQQVEGIARDQLDDGYHLGAGESLTRAAVYAQAAARFASGDERSDLLGRAVALFAEGLHHRFETVEVHRIPVADGEVGGYLVRPEGIGDGPAPTVVFLGDGTATAESMVQWVLPAVRRGLAVLVVRVGRNDAAPMDPSADTGSNQDDLELGGPLAGFLAGTDGVDPDRLGVLSLAGATSTALRLASSNVGFRAFAGWGVAWEPSKTPGGADDVVATFELPALIVHGEADREVPVVQAYQLHNALGSPRKFLQVVPRGAPGEEHGQWDCISVAQRSIAEFLRSELRGH